MFTIYEHLYSPKKQQDRQKYRLYSRRCVHIQRECTRYYSLHTPDSIWQHIDWSIQSLP